MPPVKLTLPALTENQRKLIESPARIFWWGSGTKVGKTLAAAVWMVQGLLAGERCAVVGPWYKRTRSIFDLIRQLLEIPIGRGDVLAAELKFSTKDGTGRIDFYSGDAPEAIFGDQYRRVLIDEASRQSEESLTAALTTVSAVNGRVRLCFNLERGSRNWAVRNLVRVKGMTDAERAKSSEAFVICDTASQGFVDPAVIEQVREKMPPAMFAALYEAVIPSADVALFRNLDAVFTGVEWSSPGKDSRFVMGLDLARKADYTAAVVLDSATGRVAFVDRFNEIDWGIQIARVAEIYRRFECRKAIVDATGIGDPLIEQLRKAGLNVEGFLFTGQSRKALVERLVIAFERVEVVIPPYAWLREELESFEYVLSERGEVRYQATSAHDDGAIALALACQLLHKGGEGFFVALPVDDKYAGTALAAGGYSDSRYYENGGQWARDMDAAEAERDRRNRFRGF